jgi:hypothetical protein
MPKIAEIPSQPVGTQRYIGDYNHAGHPSSAQRPPLAYADGILLSNYSAATYTPRWG